MLTRTIASKYYLSSFANLIASFGGGVVLGKGVGVIGIPYLENSSVLAFFIGTTFGLLFLQFVPKSFAKILSQAFSISSGISSLILCGIFQSFSVDNKIFDIAGLVFFVLLSLRFGFWFYARVIRADNSAGQEQSIAWVELGYYSGMILGLIIWKFLDIALDLSTALMIDAIAQFLAGSLDFIGTKFIISSSPKTENISDNKSKLHTQACQNWIWRLSLAVVFLTIAVQVVIFNLSHNVNTESGSIILAIFYFGVAVAAFIANRQKLLISWSNVKAQIIFGTQKKIAFIYCMLIAFAATSLPVLIIGLHCALRSLIIYISIFIAALMYELTLLTLLDRIGLEENILQISGMIIKTYGLMGLGAAITLSILSISTNLVISSTLILVIFIIAATVLVWRRV
jgi:hypothetical protein